MSVPATTMRIDPEPKDEANKVPGDDSARACPGPWPSSSSPSCASGDRPSTWASSRARPVRATDRRSMLPMTINKKGASADGLPFTAGRPVTITKEGDK